MNRWCQIGGNERAYPSGRIVCEADRERGADHTYKALMTIVWEVHYRNSQGEEVVYSEDGKSQFDYTTAADLAIKLEAKSGGRFYWVKSVRQEGT